MSDSLQPIRSAPLVVGVTGHRDMDPSCAERVRKEVGELFDQLKPLVPHTELRVMVGMAEGADLLVAEVALDRQIAVDAVLPMKLEDYASDFSPSGLARVRELLSRPGITRVELTPSSDDSADRDARYVSLTDTLNRKSNLLVAIWDGNSSARPGGTADTVLSFLDARGAAGRGAKLTFIEEERATSWGGQFIYWISVPRVNGPPVSAAPCYLSGIGECLVHRHITMPEELGHQLSELDDYNREIAGLYARGDLPARDSLMGTLPKDLDSALRDSLARIDVEYGKSDALAIYFQSRSDALFRWFSYLTGTVGLTFLVYTKLHAGRIALFTYVLCLLAGFALFRSLRGRSWFAKHLVYRAMAETMRIRFFLRLAGADRAVNPHELIRMTGIDQFMGFSWISNVIKNVEPLEPDSRAAAEDDVGRRAAARQAWVEGQQRYFHRKVAQLEQTHHGLERLKGLLFWFLAALVGLLLFGQSWLETQRMFAEITYKDILMFFMGFLPLMLGVWELYQSKMATRELLWQYRNQLGHFSRAKLRVSQSASVELQDRILGELGLNSLMEVYLWTIHRFHREHEPPTMG